MESIRIRVFGRVQGVYYRASTQQKAKELGLTGWVRNCSDGTVEVLAQGKRTDLNALMRWCEDGPPLARVQKVNVHWNEQNEEHTDFRILR